MAFLFGFVRLASSNEQTASVSAVSFCVLTKLVGICDDTTKFDAEKFNAEKFDAGDFNGCVDFACKHFI